MRLLILYFIACLCITTSFAQTYNGIDVSHHNGKIDWATVAKDKKIEFVYIKATTGTTGIDSCYARNIAGARKVGLKVGSYHYLTSKSSVRTQFQNFKSVAKKEQQDLIPMIDVEEVKDWSRKQVQDSLTLLVSLMKEYYGKAPMIYGTQRSYNTYCAPVFNSHHLMIGRYGGSKPEIKGRGHYSIWQYSETGKIKGIPKPVDLDCFHPDYKLSDIEL